MLPLSDKAVLVTGGTGSLGRRIIRRILSGELGNPARVVVLSRDEAKQHEMRLSYLQKAAATDDIIYKNFHDLLKFQIADVRDYWALNRALRGIQIVFHAAALKQVPTCEYFPREAIETNVLGAANLVRAAHEPQASVERVIGVSTDKACKPVNVMGMTKALQERLLVEANLDSPQTRFVCVRYGNVIASRGSVVPLFLDQIANGGPVTITMKEMTRFLLTLDQAVDTVFAALQNALPGEIYIPKAPSARVVDIAAALIGDRSIPFRFIGIRPGEKIHEIMVSEEECYRTFERGQYYAIVPMLPELVTKSGGAQLTSEFSSEQVTLDVPQVQRILQEHIEQS